MCPFPKPHNPKLSVSGIHGQAGFPGYIFLTLDDKPCNSLAILSMLKVWFQKMCILYWEKETYKVQNCICGKISTNPNRNLNGQNGQNMKLFCNIWTKYLGIQVHLVHTVQTCDYWVSWWSFFRILNPKTKSIATCHNMHNFIFLTSYDYLCHTAFKQELGEVFMLILRHIQWSKVRVTLNYTVIFVFQYRPPLLFKVVTIITAKKEVFSKQKDLDSVYLSCLRV